MSSARAYQLAWAMFKRRCDLDEIDDAADAWIDDADVRAFWVAEAEHVLQHLGKAG